MRKSEHAPDLQRELNEQYSKLVEEEKNMAKTKTKKITDVNIQRTKNGYYVYSNEDYANSPRVFEIDDADDADAMALARALDYMADLFHTSVPNKN
jgi:hypothetical protein